MSYIWPVQYLCDAQLQDVNSDDILAGGLYRKCRTYHSGGGYDKFPELFHQFYPNYKQPVDTQFVVQLKGCPLRCPYCYVTPDGVNGDYTEYLFAKDLVRAFKDSGCNVFHLMGGAPALHIDCWHEILDLLQGAPFHSDLLLTEWPYSMTTLKELAEYPNSLYAVSIKGYPELNYKRNTGVDLDRELFERNLCKIIESGLPVYFTFTGMSDDDICKFKRFFCNTYPDYRDMMDNSFAIPIIHYKALDYTQ